MGKYFKMSAAGAHYWLKKLRYSYKKKALLALRLMRANEQNTKKQ